MKKNASTCLGRIEAAMHSAIGPKHPERRSYSWGHARFAAHPSGEEDDDDDDDETLESLTEVV